ncbi:MAG: hypothetical protein ACTHKJ_01590 [Candidatus Nitrosocosmicus sp.]
MKKRAHIIKLETKGKKERGYKMGEGKNNLSKFMSKELKKFIHCLCDDDDNKNNLVSMVEICYNVYMDSIFSSVKEKPLSCLTGTISLIMVLILYQQKQISLIKSN